MANVPISGLPALGAVSDTMLYGVVSGGSTNRATHSQIKTEILNNSTMTGTTTIATANITTANITTANINTHGRLRVVNNDLYIENVTSDEDIHIRINDGGTVSTVIFCDGSTTRVGIGDDFYTPEGILHVYFTAAAEQPRFERNTNFTNILNSSCVYKATSTGNMTDGFGAAFFIHIEDNAGIDNAIAAYGAERDGADNNGRAVIGTYNGGAVTVQFEIDNTGGLFARNMTGAAPGANPALYIDSGTDEIFYDSSSQDFKENIRDLVDSDSNWIYDLVPKKANWKDGSVIDEICFIAEQVEAINPKYAFKMARNKKEIEKAKSHNQFHEDKVPIPEADIKTQGVCYSQMIVPAIAEIKKLKAEIEALKAR